MPQGTKGTAIWKDRETGRIMVAIEPNEAHELRCALQPCPCKSPKSRSTAAIRERFVKAIGRAIAPETQGRGT